MTLSSNLARREMAPRLTTVLIGEGEQPEFWETRRVLAERTALLAVPTCEAAWQLLTKGGMAAELIVVAQSRPGEFSAEQVERLQRAAPLARVVGLLGAWCEGEARTGRPWPGATRVYWYHGPAQAARNVEQWVEGICPRWGLPVTGTEEDRSLAMAAAALPQAEGWVAIAARHRETYAALADACVSAGYRASWMRSDRGYAGGDIAAGMWVGGDLSDWEARELRRFCRALAGAPVLALLDFPRISTVERAKRLGAAGVVARPFQVEDLGARLKTVSGS